MECADVIGIVFSHVHDLRMARLVSHEWRGVADTALVQRALRAGLADYLAALRVTRRVRPCVAIAYLYNDCFARAPSYVCARCGGRTRGLLLCDCAVRARKLRPRVVLIATTAVCLGVVVCAVRR
jgi:hypothetical protein